MSWFTWAVDQLEEDLADDLITEEEFRRQMRELCKMCEEERARREKETKEVL